jgi:exonuclease III
MKTMSFNCRGLANPYKKSLLKRLVESMRSDVIFLQETMGSSQVVKEALESLLVGWSFEVVDGRGRLGGLASGWRIIGCKCENLWSFD